MADKIVETPRLVLRRFSDADYPEWLAGLNTGEVRAHIGGIDDPARAAQRFARQQGSWDEASGGWLAIARRDDGAFLGVCGFGPIETAAAPDGLRGEREIGWQLRANCWGHGYATEAARAMLGLAFSRFGAPVIFAQTSEANRASWRVMERLGMERRADLDYDDPDYSAAENPTKVYAIARAAWDEGADRG